MERKCMKRHISPLYKRLKREFRDNLGRYIAIMIMFVISITVIAGFLVTAASTMNAITEGTTRYKLEDGQFTVAAPLTSDQITAVEENDITIYENFCINHEIGNDTTLRFYINRTAINLASILSGKLPQTENEIAIDRVFANENSLKIGDSIDGFLIVGMIALPDYLSLYENNSEFMLNTKTFGVAVITKEAFLKLDGKKIYTYSFRTNRHINTDTKELRKKEQYDLMSSITKTLYQQGAEVTNAMSASMNQAIAFFREDAGSDVPMMKVLLFIILLIIAFVFVVLTNHTIESESVIIGTLLANGYRKGEIIRHYMLLPGIVTFLSAAIGNLLGYTVMTDAFYKLYNHTYSIPVCKTVFDPEAFLLTTVAPLLIVLLVEFIGISHKLRISPLNFLRRELKKSGKKGAVRLPDFSFLRRFRIRILLQNIGSYAVLFFGIFFASFLLLFGIGMSPLFSNYVDSIEDTLLAENQYLLNQPVEVGEGNKMTMTTLSFYSNTMKKNLEITLYGLDELHGETVQEGEVLLADSLLKKEKLSKLKSLQLVNEYTEKEYTVYPTGEISYHAGFILILNRRDLNRMLGYGETYFKGYLSDSLLNIDESYVDKLITKYDMTKIADQMISSLSGMIPMFVVVAVVIYLVLMYILTKLAIDKNALCISFMKVFGYRGHEVNSLYLNGGTYVVILSLVLCIPLEFYGLQLAMNFVMMKINGYMEAKLQWYVYGEVVLTGLISYFTIHFFHKRHVDRIPMTEALKNRE